MNDELKKVVREKYGAAARAAAGGGSATCCGPAPSPPKTDGGCACGSDAPGAGDPITRDLYDEATGREVPDTALRASLGCGHPTALAELHPGEVVLDLGSGGGIDVLLSARRVGPTGKAYGVDMTDDMLELARRNAHEAGARNVEFLKGEIEALPLPDASVDVIISNCVINLSGDKDRVFAEAFRVLKPGGRLAVSDVVVRGPVPEEIRRSMELWVGCVAGALNEDEVYGKLTAAGFEDISVEPTRVYRVEDAAAFLREAGLDPETVGPEIDGRFMAAFVRARRPQPSS